MDVRIDRDLVVELTRALIRFQSVNPPGNEQGAAEYLGKRMREFGLEVELQQLEPDRAQVIGRIKGSGTGHLVYTGHLDVVPPGSQEWSHDPFAADLVDGTIYGRGSVDMKGGVAAIVAAAAALQVAGFKPAADYIIAATAGEEAGMFGAAAMVERRSLEGSRYLVVAEPTGLDLYIGEKGVLWVELRALGRTAHGSMPWLGVNAIGFVARLIPWLEEYPFPFHESSLLGKPSLSVNVIEGGDKVNVVPDLCRVELDLRTVPGQDHQALLRRLRTVAGDIASHFNENLHVELRVLNDKPAIETDPGDPLIDAVFHTIHSVCGRKPEIAGVSYGTDAAYLAPGFGIPMVICGPGSTGLLHQTDEHVEVDELVQAAEIYAALAQRLLG